MEDLYFVEGIKSGNTEALEKLVNKYSKYIAKIVSAIGRNYLTSQDIEEVTADCFISFWKNSSTFEMKADSIKSYLAAIARNKVKNILSSRKIEYLPLEEDVLF